MKAPIELIKAVLHRNELDVRMVSQIIEDISTEMAAQEEEVLPPPLKKQFVILISDPRGTLDGRDYVGWVCQIPEDDSPYVTEERLIRSAYEFNQTPKGRRLPVRTIAETCEVVGSKIFKETGVWIRTKEPVSVLFTDNKIPMDQLNRLRKADRE